MNRVQPLQADVFALARERHEFAGELPLVALPRLAASLLATDGVLRYRIRGAVDDRGRAGAVMHLRASLPLECQRCGRHYDFELRRDAHFRFVADEARLNAEPDDDDDVDVVVGSTRMELTPWIEDEAILSLPLVPRHDADDPRCRPAVLLAEAGGVGGPETVRPNPFAALAALQPGGKPN